MTHYFNDSGVLFFLIEIKDFDTYRIYYASLQKFDLQALLHEAKNQPSKRIKLDLFPHRYIEGMLHILDDFRLNKKQQATLLPNVYSMDDLKATNLDIEQISISMSAIGIDNEADFARELLSHPQYLYVTPRNMGIPFVAEKISVDEITLAGKGPVTVDGKILYDHIDIVRHASGENFFKLGSDVTIKPNGKGLTINYAFKGTLSEQIKETQFMLAWLQNKQILIGDRSFPLSPRLASGDQSLEEVLRRQKAFLRVADALKKFNVKKDLNLGDLSDNDIIKLNSFVTGVLDKKPIPLSFQGQTGAGKLTIGNISVLVRLSVSPQKSKFFIKSLFDEANFMLTTEEDSPESGHAISPYVLLTAELLKTIDNIDLDNIVPEIKKVPYSQVYGGRIVSLILELLKYFDEEKDNSVLEIAVQLLDYLQENDPSDEDLYRINRLQTVKRHRNLTVEENRYLMEIKSSDASQQYKLAASILLGSFQEAQILYDLLPENERQQFDEYPIKNLWGITSTQRDG